MRSRAVAAMATANQVTSWATINCAGRTGVVDIRRSIPSSRYAPM